MYVLLGNGEAVDDGVADVLLLHRLEHPWDDGSAGSIIFHEMIPWGGGLTDDVGTPFSQFLFVWFGIVEIFIAHQALAVTNHPDFAVKTAEDDGAGGEPVFWMF